MTPELLAIGLAAAGSVLCAVCMWRKCERCNGSGYVNIKNGGVKPCPFCNAARQSTQLVHEGVDWLYWCLVACILASLLLGSVAGHYFVSVGMQP